jgi:hypothetical protein
MLLPPSGRPKKRAMKKDCSALWNVEATRFFATLVLMILK